MADHPAIALIEFSSVAAGTRASDALAKKAPVVLVRAGTLQPGKYAILFSGDVASVEESYVEGLRVGADAVQDRVWLPDVHRQVYDAVLGRRGNWTQETLGVIETSTLAGTIEAADAAVKGAQVEVIEIRLGDGLGGKGLAHFGGLQADVEAAIEIGVERISQRASGPRAPGLGRAGPVPGSTAPGRESHDHDLDIQTAIIPRVDADLRSSLGKSTRFAEDV